MCLLIAVFLSGSPFLIVSVGSRCGDPFWLPGNGDAGLSRKYLSRDGDNNLKAFHVDCSNPICAESYRLHAHRRHAYGLVQLVVGSA